MHVEIDYGALGLLYKSFRYNDTYVDQLTVYTIMLSMGKAASAYSGVWPLFSESFDRMSSRLSVSARSQLRGSSQGETSVSNRLKQPSSFEFGSDSVRLRV